MRIVRDGKKYLVVEDEKNYTQTLCQRVRTKDSFIRQEFSKQNVVETFNDFDSARNFLAINWEKDALEEEFSRGKIDLFGNYDKKPKVKNKETEDEDL